jgi:hypothetical protein
MDDKTITAISTSLALMQIQVNALLLLFEQQTGLSIKEDFQRLIKEGVQTVGLETMQGIKSRIYEGIVQQEPGDSGNGLHWPSGFFSYGNGQGYTRTVILQALQEGAGCRQLLIKITTAPTTAISAQANSLSPQRLKRVRTVVSCWRPFSLTSKVNACVVAHGISDVLRIATLQ